MSSSGFINYNKESGISSAAAVSFVKRLSGIPCGHMGTLDPLASGVLPVAVGNASRLFNYLLDKQKVYRAVFRFGRETDTLDCTGETLQSGLPVPSQEAVCAALPAFIGDIEQVPPQYSAKSVNGRRSYELARAGQEVEMLDDQSLHASRGDEQQAEVVRGKPAHFPVIHKVDGEVFLQFGQQDFVATAHCGLVVQHGGKGDEVDYHGGCLFKFGAVKVAYCVDMASCFLLILVFL